MNIHIHGGHRKIYGTNKTHILKGVYEAIPYATKAVIQSKDFFPKLTVKPFTMCCFSNIFKHLQVVSKLVSLLNKKENQVIMVFIVNICISQCI